MAWKGKKLRKKERNFSFIERRARTQIAFGRGEKKCSEGVDLGHGYAR